jgi:hypothetical protein
MPLQGRIDPEPPELKTPWRTEARIELQMEARVFARDIVLPNRRRARPPEGRNAEEPYR